MTSIGHSAEENSGVAPVNFGEERLVTFGDHCSYGTVPRAGLATAWRPPM